LVDRGGFGVGGFLGVGLISRSLLWMSLGGNDVDVGRRGDEGEGVGSEWYSREGYQAMGYSRRGL
jgi:hypothetical protein